MVVNKFSNIPPFYLKEEKSVVSAARHKRIHAKSNNEVTKIKSDHSGSHTASSNSRKLNSIIPKVIESFQKVTPKIDSNYMESSRASLKTLFRNSNISFGKHIPDHAVMKNLLQNFDVDTKKEKVTYRVVDIIPTKDPNSKYRVVSKKSTDKKVDKSTSTTGLGLAANSKKSNQQCSNGGLLRKKTSKTNRRKRTDVLVDNYDTSKIKVVNEEVHPVEESTYNINQRQKHTRSCAKCKGMRQDTFVVEKNIERTAADFKYREKSFVQSQVEKLNAIYASKSQGKPSIDVKRLGSRKFSYTQPIEVK